MRSRGRRTVLSPAAEFTAWLILAWLIVLAFLAGATWAFVRFV